MDRLVTICDKLKAHRQELGATQADINCRGGSELDTPVWNVLELALYTAFPSKTQVLCLI